MHLSALETRIGLRQPEPGRARASHTEKRREHGLRLACALMHLLAGCAFVVAGVFTCEFILLIHFVRGALLSLVVYSATATAVWLAGRSDPDI
jgi:hypothetical protein